MGIANRRVLAMAVGAGAVVAVAVMLAYAAATDAWLDPGGALFVALVATWLFAGAGSAMRGLLRVRPVPPGLPNAHVGGAPDAADGQVRDRRGERRPVYQDRGPLLRHAEEVGDLGKRSDLLHARNLPG